MSDGGAQRQNNGFIRIGGRQGKRLQQCECTGTVGIGHHTHLKFDGRSAGRSLGIERQLHICQIQFININLRQNGVGIRIVIVEIQDTSSAVCVC